MVSNFIFCNCLNNFFFLSHIINDLAFNNNGETLLVASGNCQLKLLDRQGKQWAETVCGINFIYKIQMIHSFFFFQVINI